MFKRQTLFFQEGSIMYKCWKVPYDGFWLITKTFILLLIAAVSAAAVVYECIYGLYR